MATLAAGDVAASGAREPGLRIAVAIEIYLGAWMDSFPGWLPYAATPVVGAVTLLWWLSHRQRKPFPALPNPSAPFFKDEYEDARQLFRERAAAAGAKLHILPLEGECWGGQCGDPNAFEGANRLTVDVAVVKGSDCRADGSGPLLLHVSGIHGVEGHAGSAIQCRWLDMVAAGAATVPSGTTVALIHVMNPYGYKHGRRYNENNVDLNRNLLVGLDGTPIEKGCGFDWGRDSHPAKPDYELFSPAFNYKRRWHCPWDDVAFFVKAAYYLCRYEYTALKRAAVSGQYHNKDGIWFGGTNLQPSYKALLVRKDNIILIFAFL
eukprot:SAG31_NODE_4121_length_3562_cov_5.914525_1_plen_321_part_00